MACSGYYDYDEGYTPDFPGMQDFQGTSSIPSTGPKISTTPARRSS